MVIIVMAVASVLGMAMLSAGSLQADVSASTVKAAQADALAESGVQLAMYYLQHPSDAPTGFPTGPLTTAINSGVPGTVTVSIAPVTGQSSQYIITSIGSSQADATATIRRSVAAAVTVNKIYQFNAASGFNAAVNLPSGVTINGNGGTAIECGVSNGNAMVTQSAGSVVEGNIVEVTGNTTAVPTAAQITSYSSYTDAQGNSGKATALASGTLNGSTLGATAGNPDGVYIVTGNLTLKGNVTINGSLIVNGMLTVSSGANVAINTGATQSSGIPSLVVTNTVTIAGPSAATVNVKGVTWLGNNITSSGGGNASDAFNVTGALMMDQGSITTLYKGKINVNYSGTWASAPSIAPGNTPENLTVTSWTPG